MKRVKIQILAERMGILVFGLFIGLLFLQGFPGYFALNPMIFTMKDGIMFFYMPKTCYLISNV